LIFKAEVRTFSGLLIRKRQIVTTGTESLPELLDTLQAVHAVGHGVLLIVVLAEVLEVAFEYSMELATATGNVLIPRRAPHNMIRNAPPLRLFVETLWLCDAYMPMSPSEFVLPTGTVEIVIDLGGGILRVSDSTRPLQYESFHGAVVCGPHSEPFVIDTSQPADLLGVHFAPGGAFPFLGVPLDELRNHRVSLSELWGQGGDEFLERALAGASRSNSIEAIEEGLVDRMRSGSTLHPAVSVALKAFHGGSTRIGPIKREIGLSSRHSSLIHGAQSVDWAALALRYGFSDQAHLVNDFRASPHLLQSGYIVVEEPRGGEYGPAHRETTGPTRVPYDHPLRDRRFHADDWKRRRVEWKPFTGGALSLHR